VLELNWADWTLLGIIALSSLISVVRGFTKEAFSLLIWLAAFVVARSFQPQAQTLLAPQIEDPALLAVAAFLVLFIGTLLVGAVLSYLVSFLVKITGLSTLDRVLGVVFGMARGLIVCVVVVAMVRHTDWVLEQWWADSVVIEQLTVLEYWSRSVLAPKVGELSSALVNLKL